MKNLFQDAFNESLDKEGAGVMHYADQKAKEAGKKVFKLGNKTFPVKEKKKLEDEGNAFGQAVQNTPKGQEIKIHGHDTGEVKKEVVKTKANKIAENYYGASLGLEAKPAPTPAPEAPAPDEGEKAWSKSLDPKTDPSKFDGAENPSLTLDTKGIESAREWIKKLDDMATFINGMDEHSLNAQINSLEMRNSIPFKGIVRREEKRITKLAENLRGLAELFKTVVTSSNKKIHDATSRISSR